MKAEHTGFGEWTPEQMALGKRYVEIWKETAVALERVRREELRRLDSRKALALLSGPADYRVPPRAPKATSGLIDQQRWFMKALQRD